ncbi:MAG TPA: thiamine phosphate synthase [Sphingomonadales bacterium]|nr:thiamine phosphate synthase [Sphingomonadales bacterium]
MTRTQLYLITPPKIDIERFARDLSAALDGGPVASVQLRLKDATDTDIITAAQVLMPICHARDVAFIINDRPDIARDVKADGVHVGQDDMPYAEARTIVGPDSIVGVTCKDSRHLSMTAAEQGADYVAFGAFYDTDTKDGTSPADIAILTWWAELFEVPSVAIGGITVDNAAPLIEAGADFIAVCGGVWNHAKGPQEAVKEFMALL